MAGCDGSVAPENEARGVADDGKASATIGGNDNGRADKHALSTALHDAVHDDQHHGAGGEVIEVCRDDECGKGKRPKQVVGSPHAHVIGNKVEASVVVEQLNNRHRSQQEHDDGGCLAHILQKDIVADEILDGLARCWRTMQVFGIVVRMLTHDEVAAPTHVDHPSCRTNKHGDSCFVDARQVSRCYEQIAEDEQ